MIVGAVVLILAIAGVVALVVTSPSDGPPQ